MQIEWVVLEKNHHLAATILTVSVRCLKLSKQKCKVYDILHSLRVFPYKILITYKGKTSNLIVGKIFNITLATVIKINITSSGTNHIVLPLCLLTYFLNSSQSKIVSFFLFLVVLFVDKIRLVVLQSSPQPGICRMHSFLK